MTRLSATALLSPSNEPTPPPPGSCVCMGG